MSKPTTPLVAVGRRSARRSPRLRAWCRIAVSSWRTTIGWPSRRASSCALVEPVAAPPRRPRRGSARPAGAARGRSAPRRTPRRRRPGPRTHSRATRRSCVGGLHHRDRVVERLEVALQRAGVRRLREPAAAATSASGAGSSCPISAASSTIVCGPQPAVEVVVQQHLRGAGRSARGWRRYVRCSTGHGAIQPSQTDHEERATMRVFTDVRRARRGGRRGPRHHRLARRSTRSASTCSPTPPATTSGSTSTCERAKDGPFGGTIAHGYLTLSLVPLLGPAAVRASRRRRQAQLRRQQGALPQPGPGRLPDPGAPPRSPTSADVPAGKQLVTRYTIEIEGETSRPASPRPSCSC